MSSESTSFLSGKFKWIEDFNIKLLEVPYVSSNNDESKNAGCGGDHGIGGEIGGAAMHKAGPLAEDSSVGR